ncbi:hypothetical protein ScalyP_jg1225 [Parmales sp. scaly parma]|nr:hypothetical protein ScalyP_jg1225 [Parmales sp. scaly parma]
MTMHDFDPNSNSSLSPIPPVRTWSSLAQSRALSLHTKLISAPSSLYSPYSKALAHLGSAIRLYGPENIYVSYNGGKDAVVVEVLYRLALAVHNNKHENSDSKTTPPPLSIFFDDPQDFTQIKSFVSSTSTYHDLSLIRLLNCDFKSGLSSIINSSSEGGGRNLAFVLGTRNSDPNGANQDVFSPSSDYMPPFMRVNPIIDWDYGLVWAFLKFVEGAAEAGADPAVEAYCGLYDEGYTSLGRVGETGKNPALRLPGGGYRPAYELKEYGRERDGRTKKQICHVPLSVVHVIPDSVQLIAESVADLRKSYDYLITSGGVGSTHDDVTLKGISKATGRELSVNMEMLEFICKKTGDEEAFDIVNDENSGRGGGRRASSTAGANIKLSTFPTCSTLLFLSGEDEWPILRCEENVFVLPGVPEFFEKKIKLVAKHLGETAFGVRGGGVNNIVSAKAEVFLTVKEAEIFNELNYVVSLFEKRGGGLAFGSYPKEGEEKWKTVVTVEGGREEVEESVQELRKVLGEKNVWKSVVK